MESWFREGFRDKVEEYVNVYMDLHMCLLKSSRTYNDVNTDSMFAHCGIVCLSLDFHIVKLENNTKYENE